MDNEPSRMVLVGSLQRGDRVTVAARNGDLSFEVIHAEAAGDQTMEG